MQEMVAPEIWGPRLWRILHTMADLSDRNDIYPLWNTFLRTTITNIPCQKCQIHMAEYWRTHPFLPKGWQSMTAEQVRQDIRQKLNRFHNSVNHRLGKPIIPLVNLGSLDRQLLYVQIREDFEVLKSIWPSIHIEWKKASSLLFTLIQCGPKSI